MIMEGFVRRFLAMKSGKNQTELRFTHQESVAVGLVEPINFEFTRAGRRFFLGNSAAATGIAPVQAVPTTAAQWVIWNADPAATYFFEELGAILASGTPGLGASLLFALFSAPAQTGSSATGMSVQSASQGSRASKAIIKSGVTITTPAAPAWFQLDESRDAIAAAAFSTGYANGLFRRDLAGAIAIQPGQGLGLAVMAPTGTTPLYIPMARWVEQETDME
jgi:hypothetical protein